MEFGELHNNVKFICCHIDVKWSHVNSKNSEEVGLMHFWLDVLTEYFHNTTNIKSYRSDITLNLQYEICSIQENTMKNEQEKI